MKLLFIVITFLVVIISVQSSLHKIILDSTEKEITDFSNLQTYQTGQSIDSLHFIFTEENELNIHRVTGVITGLVNHKLKTILFEP